MPNCHETTPQALITTIQDTFKSKPHISCLGGQPDQCWQVLQEVLFLFKKLFLYSEHCKSAKFNDCKNECVFCESGCLSLWTKDHVSSSLILEQGLLWTKNGYIMNDTMKVSQILAILFLLAAYLVNINWGFIMHWWFPRFLYLPACKTHWNTRV